MLKLFKLRYRWILLPIFHTMKLMETLWQFDVIQYAFIGQPLTINFMPYCVLIRMQLKFGHTSFCGNKFGFRANAGGKSQSISPHTMFSFC